MLEIAAGIGHTGHGHPRVKVKLVAVALCAVIVLADFRGQRQRVRRPPVEIQGADAGNALELPHRSARFEAAEIEPGAKLIRAPEAA